GQVGQLRRELPARVVAIRERLDHARLRLSEPGNQAAAIRVPRCAARKGMFLGSASSDPVSRAWSKREFWPDNHGMRLFPLFADLQGRAVLVVGGGDVAARKIKALLEAGAAVTAGAVEFL